MTKPLLVCGILAGPLYMAVYLGQAFTRSGFDITRHPASVLSNGDLGWIQVANFVVTAGLTIAAGIGIRRALRSGSPGNAGGMDLAGTAGRSHARGTARGSTWAPILIGLFGLSMLLAAIFTADPVDGFPPGTPLGLPTTISTTGLLHFVTGLIGFSCWIAASFVFARRFAALGQRGWALFSTATGVVFLIAFFGGPAGIPVMGLVIAITLAWIWLSATSAQLLAQQP
jgi:hypothetical protein